MGSKLAINNDTEEISFLESIDWYVNLFKIIRKYSFNAALEKTP